MKLAVTITAVLIGCHFAVAGGLAPARAQDLSPPEAAEPPTAAGGNVALQTPAKVDVTPLARDSEIAERLENILTATGWFDSAKVEVRDGVVFQQGSTSSEQHKTWAGDLARRTQDVAAVVNKIEVQRSSIWDLRPASEEIGNLWRKFILSLPNILFAILILTIAWWIGKLVTRISRRLAVRRLDAPLLREVLARAVGFFFLLGLYLVLRIPTGPLATLAMGYDFNDFPASSKVFGVKRYPKNKNWMVRTDEPRQQRFHSFACYHRLRSVA